MKFSICTASNYWTLYNAIMPHTTATAARTAGQRAGLTPDQILHAARAVLRGTGASGFSLRKVAAEAGVAPNAIYSYFADRNALIDALLDDTLQEVQSPPPDADPMGGLRLVITSTYDLLVREGELVPLYLARSGSRGEHAWRLGARMLQLLRSAGVAEKAAQVALQVLIIQSIGFAAFVSASQPSAQVRARRRAEFVQALEWTLIGIRATA